MRERRIEDIEEACKDDPSVAVENIDFVHETLIDGRNDKHRRAAAKIYSRLAGPEQELVADRAGTLLDRATEHYGEIGRHLATAIRAVGPSLDAEWFDRHRHDIVDKIRLDRPQTSGTLVGTLTYDPEPAEEVIVEALDLAFHIAFMDSTDGPISASAFIEATSETHPGLVAEHSPQLRDGMTGDVPPFSGLEYVQANMATALARLIDRESVDADAAEVMDAIVDILADRNRILAVNALRPAATLVKHDPTTYATLAPHLSRCANTDYDDTRRMAGRVTVEIAADQPHVFADPEELQATIEKLADEFEYETVDIDTALDTLAAEA